MKRAAILLLALLLLVPMLQAAGSVAVVSSAVNVSGQVSGVRAYTYEWTSDGSGNVSTNAVIVSPGAYLVQVQFEPGTGAAQPSDNYDVTLLNSKGVDLLDGVGLNCDDTVGRTESRPGIWIDRAAVLQLTVAGAGATNTGRLVLWYGPQ